MSKRVRSKYKINRRLGCNLWGRPKSPWNTREYGPGQHGQRRRKPTDFGIQLMAKQKLKGYYGNITEKQFRRTYREAVKRRGDTVEALIGLLEQRLDAVVYRMKFVPTVFASRQFVNHGHIKVNGRRVDIASYRVRVGDQITVRDTVASKALATRYLMENPRFAGAEWLAVDREALTVSVNRLPQRDEIDANANEQLIVELYSK